MNLNPSKLSRYRLLPVCSQTSIRRIVSVVFVLFCVVGFFVHILIAASDYFQYKTLNEMSFHNNDMLRYPSILICFRYDYQRDQGISYYVKAANEDMRPPTLRQLFSLTTDSQYFLTHCATNNDRNASLNDVPRTECLNWLIIQKAFAGSNVCYRLVPKPGLYYSWAKTTGRLRQSNEIYAIFLNQTFNDADIITVTYFYSPENNLDYIPTYARHYSKRYIFKHEVENTSHQKLLVVYAEQHHYFRLPPPHDSMCREGSNICLRNCFFKGTKALQILPYAELIFEPSDLRILQYKDMEENATIHREIMLIASECRAQCEGLPCDFKVSFTKGHDFALPDIHQFLVSLSPPTAPELIITTVPLMRFTDFLLYLSNCIGIWFGISVRSLNPLKLFQRKS